MEKCIMITTTFDDIDEANNIMQILLEKHLVSCCQIFNINSSYHWKGSIEHCSEYLVQMKTQKKLYDEVEKVILKNHSYEVPQIVAYDIAGGSDEYLKWICDETNV